MSGDHRAENIYGRHSRLLHRSKAISADAFAEQNNSGPGSGPEFFYALNEALIASRQGSAEVPSYGRKLIASPRRYKCRLRSERLSRLEQTSSGKMMRVIADGAPLQTSAGNSIRELISSSSRSMASIVASSRSSAASCSLRDGSVKAAKPTVPPVPFRR